MLGDRVGGPLHGLLVAKIVMPERLQVAVQLVNQGDPRRDVQLDDRIVRHAVEVFHQGAERIPVRHDQDAPAGSDLGGDRAPASARLRG